MRVRWERVFGINETCILVMLLGERERSEVQQAFIKIKNSMDQIGSVGQGMERIGVDRNGMV